MVDLTLDFNVIGSAELVHSLLLFVYVLKIIIVLNWMFYTNAYQAFCHSLVDG